jgi:hypothetical protein
MREVLEKIEALTLEKEECIPHNIRGNITRASFVLSCQYSNFPTMSWREQLNYQWDDDKIRFLLDQHTDLDVYSASSLKQQSAGRYVSPLGNIILIPSQPVFALSP